MKKFNLHTLVGYSEHHEDSSDSSFEIIDEEECFIFRSGRPASGAGNSATTSSCQLLAPAMSEVPNDGRSVVLDGANADASAEITGMEPHTELNENLALVGHNNTILMMPLLYQLIIMKPSDNKLYFNV